MDLTIDGDITGEVAPAPATTTAGLFKKSKKRAVNNDATAGGSLPAGGAVPVGIESRSTPAAAASSASSSRLRTSRLSFDDEAESVAEAAAGGVDLVALQLRLDREKRKKAKKLKAAQAAEATPKATNTNDEKHTSNTQHETTNLYTPEALAALRRNARPFSSASLSAAASSVSESNRGVDRVDIEPEVNLAALPSSTGGAFSAPPPPTAFRMSGRSQQLAMQEADDMRRMSAKLSGSSKADAIVLADDEEDEKTKAQSKRDRELDRLAEERMIRAAKLKRERMRQQGVGQDDDLQFIPLSSQATSLAVRGDGLGAVELDRSYAVAVLDDDDDPSLGQSALLRDDPDDAMINEYDDEALGRGQGQITADRIRFGDPAASKDRKRLPVGALLSQSAEKKNRSQAIRNALQQESITIDDDDDDVDDGLEGGAERVPDDDDDETRLWEEELMRKGGARADVAHAAAKKPNKNARASTIVNTAPNEQLSLSQQIESSMAAEAAQTGRPAGAIDPIDILLHGLNTQLTSMEVSHARSNTRYRQLEGSLHLESTKLHGLRSKFDTTSDTFLFYQHLSEKLLTLLDCLSEKSRDVEAAWAERNEMYRTRAKEIEERIDEHQKDMFEEAFGVAQQQQANDTTRVDEFGRTIGFVHDEEKARRREVRRQWLDAQVQQLQVELATAAHTPVESSKSTTSGSPSLGWCSFRTLVESPSELGSQRFSDSVSSLIADSHAIFSDVSPEFRTLDGCIEWMEGWKRRERETYDHAFIPESMPVIIATYVKLELLQNWDIIKHPCFSQTIETNDRETTDSNKQGWYAKLFSYGMDCGPARVVDGVAVDDPDSHLLPSLVDQLILPIVSQFVLLQFDPFDPSHMRSLRAVLRDCDAHLVAPDASINLKGVKAAIMTEMRRRVQQHHQYHAAPNIPPTHTPSIAQQNQASFCLFRFHIALHLFESIVSLQDLLDSQETKALASQHLVQSLLPFLAWKCAQVDTSLGQPATTVVRDAEPTTLLVSMAPLNRTPLAELTHAAARFIQVLPREWIAQGTNTSSIAQLYQLLTQLQQADNTTQVHAAVKQLRGLLKR